MYIVISPVIGLNIMLVIDSLNQMPMPFPSFMLDAFATLVLTFELTS